MSKSANELDKNLEPVIEDIVRKSENENNTVKTKDIPEKDLNIAQDSLMFQ